MHPQTSKLNLYQTLQEDLRLQKPRNPNAWAMIAAFVRNAGFMAVFLYRLSAACHPKGWFGRVMAVFLRRFNLMVNGCDISPEAVIGPRFLISHPVGVVIGKAKIGRNVFMLQNTTLGLRRHEDNDDDDDSASYPMVGDDVMISAGAVILGGVMIGRGAQIGANAVVLNDVPEFSTAVGVPARILEKRNPPSS